MGPGRVQRDVVVDMGHGAILPRERQS
jgi:hypothetical protein